MLVAWSRRKRKRKREKPPLSLPEGRKRWETPSVPLFRGKKCEASLSLPKGRSVMWFIMYDD